MAINRTPDYCGSGEQPSLMRQITKYKNILKKDPNDAEALFQMAMEFEQQKYFPQAIHHFQEAIKLKPCAQYRLPLAQLFLDLKRYSEAQMVFKVLLDSGSASAEAYRGLGEALVGQKRVSEALDYFQKALGAGPPSSTTHFGLGRALLKLERSEEALDQFKEALKVNTGNFRARFYVGFTLCKLERFQEAVTIFKSVVEADPKSSEGFANLGYAYNGLKQYQEAINAYKWALKLNPNLYEIHQNMQEALRKLKAVNPKAESEIKAETDPFGTPRWNGKGLGRVAGMGRLKRLLYEEVLKPIQNPELYQRFRLTIPNGILLYGPPGCGKTFIAKNLAQELGWHFMDIHASSIASTYIHGTVLAIRDIFKKAAEHAPTLLFIDEFEGLVPKRVDLSGQQQHKAEEVNEFLVLLNECAEKKIFVVSATNEPEKIDEAVRRPGRLDKMIYVGPPDFEARVQALKMYLMDRPVENVDPEGIARKLEGYPFSDISHITDEAARLALRREKTFISNKEMLEAIQRNPCSLTVNTLSKYKHFQQRGI